MFFSVLLKLINYIFRNALNSILQFTNVQNGYQIDLHHLTAISIQNKSYTCGTAQGMTECKGVSCVKTAVYRPLETEEKHRQTTV